MVVTLLGPRLRMRPLRSDDSPRLARAASDGALWSLPFTIVPSPETVDAYLQNALRTAAAGESMPFGVELRAEGELIGSTRFIHPDAAARTIEISHTWISASRQGSFAHAEMHYLMLEYAFEQLGCIRVQWRADETNVRSRRAIMRLGAMEEGLMRHDRVMLDGRKRNAFLYSMIDDDWPSAKRRLSERLESFD